jgi:hypothetical protein
MVELFEPCVFLGHKDVSVSFIARCESRFSVTRRPAAPRTTDALLCPLEQCFAGTASEHSHRDAVSAKRAAPTPTSAIPQTADCPQRQEYIVPLGGLSSVISRERSGL